MRESEMDSVPVAASGDRLGVGVCVLEAVAASVRVRDHVTRRLDPLIDRSFVLVSEADSDNVTTPEADDEPEKLPDTSTELVSLRDDVTSEVVVRLSDREAVLDMEAVASPVSVDESLTESDSC